GAVPPLPGRAGRRRGGGGAQTLAARALWTFLLPAVCFPLPALLAWLAGRYRRGLR
ncbi:thiamine ABC transporter permease, partial [Klebsiella pneumoniae]|nr:thiamine ABC transporter permease [Klebsiella pneumoniae]